MPPAGGLGAHLLDLPVSCLDPLPLLWSDGMPPMIPSASPDTGRPVAKATCLSMTGPSSFLRQSDGMITGLNDAVGPLLFQMVNPCTRLPPVLPASGAASMAPFAPEFSIACIRNSCPCDASPA